MPTGHLKFSLDFKNLIINCILLFKYLTKNNPIYNYTTVLQHTVGSLEVQKPYIKMIRLNFHADFQWSLAVLF